MDHLLELLAYLHRLNFETSLLTPHLGPQKAIPSGWQAATPSAGTPNTSRVDCGGPVSPLAGTSTHVWVLAHTSTAG